jgi:adenylosuccinate lyase
MADYMYSIISSWGIMANFANNTRDLQKTEIAEVSESFGKNQVGSSTMPHKRNPIKSEQVVGSWREYHGQINVLLENQISEHNRDLINSYPSRHNQVRIEAFDSAVRKATKLVKGLTVKRENMKKNLRMSSSQIIAEPLQIFLSEHGYPDAHERVRTLSMESYANGKPLIDLVFSDRELEPYLQKFSLRQNDIIIDPEKYIGQAILITEEVCDTYEALLEELASA